RALEKDKLHGFELGADDYVTKPFSFKELCCRIMAVLRRLNIAAEAADKEVLQIGVCSLNTGGRILTVNGSDRKLSQREAELLAMLLRNKEHYINRNVILASVWGRDDYFTARSMDVYITRIRKLLKDDPSVEIENLYGSG